MWFVIVLVLVVVAIGSFVLFVRWGIRWGATPQEVAARMTGDVYLEGGPRVRQHMTRAISINAPPETVWAWGAQLGRGAGWYTFDRLDNGGKRSAEHLVSWIPAPQLGDATAIGYLRHLDTGREAVWWLSGEQWLGVTLRMVSDFLVTPEGNGTRLVIRVSGDGDGLLAWPVVAIFMVIDSIMAIRQLKGFKRRAERYDTRTRNPDRPETGARDQYQLYEILYTSGDRAGVSGKEHGPRWRQAAIDDGVIVE
jgi:hypothetical protein